MIKNSITLPFCTINIYDKAIVTIANEDIFLTETLCQEIIKAIAMNKGLETPKVYIIQRLYSYSVDPTIYLNTAHIENLAGLAIVAKQNAAGNAEVEKLFVKVPFEIFTDIKEALKWAEITTDNYIRFKGSNEAC